MCANDVRELEVYPGHDPNRRSSSASVGPGPAVIHVRLSNRRVLRLSLLYIISPLCPTFLNCSTPSGFLAERYRGQNDSRRNESNPSADDGANGDSSAVGTSDEGDGLNISRTATHRFLVAFSSEYYLFYNMQCMLKYCFVLEPIRTIRYVELETGWVTTGGEAVATG